MELALAICIRAYELRSQRVKNKDGHVALASSSNLLSSARSSIARFGASPVRVWNSHSSTASRVSLIALHRNANSSLYRTIVILSFVTFVASIHQGTACTAAPRG